MENQSRTSAAQSLRVLHILSGDLWAGKECQVVLQLEALIKLNCNVRLLLFNEGETASRARAAGIAVILLDERAGLRVLLSQSLANAHAFQPEIVVAHGHKELLIGLSICRSYAAATTEPRLISAFHGAPELHRGWRQVKVHVALFVRKLISRFFATRLTAVSKELIRELGLPPAKTHVVYNVAVPDLKSSGVRNNYTFVIVGRLVGVKRVDLALRSFAALKQRLIDFENYELHIIGEGPLRNELQRTSELLGITAQVKFLGFCTDAPQRIASAKLMLLTSLREGVPTVVLESLYARTPFVTTPLPGVQEVLALIPPVPAIVAGNSSPETIADAIAETIGKLTTADNRSLSLSDKPVNREWPADLDSCLNRYFSPSAAAQHLLNIYLEVLAA